MAKAAAVRLPIGKDANQSTIWLGALLAMFILYLAMNNRLAVYWSLLTGGTGSTASSSTGAAAAPQSGAGSTGGTITITPLTGQTPPATTGGNAP
jgi:hypothetical protein